MIYLSYCVNLKLWFPKKTVPLYYGRNVTCLNIILWSSCLNKWCLLLFKLQHWKVISTIYLSTYTAMLILLILVYIVYISLYLFVSSWINKRDCLPTSLIKLNKIIVVWIWFAHNGNDRKAQRICSDISRGIGYWIMERKFLFRVASGYLSRRRLARRCLMAVSNNRRDVSEHQPNVNAIFCYCRETITWTKRFEACKITLFGNA